MQCTYMFPPFVASISNPSCFRRVTEVVRGVKGASCEKVTEAINKQLGNVVYTQPTEEMFEQELVVEQTVDQKLGGEWDGTSSW